MSYHVIHIRTHGAVLKRHRGRIRLMPPDGSEQPERSIALEDIKALIIAARGVTITSATFSALLEQGGCIVHCNNRYVPVGMSLPLPRVVCGDAMRNQLVQPKVLNKNIWKTLLRQKIENQAHVLDSLECSNHRLWAQLKSSSLDEGNSARHYWSKYFPALGWSKMRRDRRLHTKPNLMLNYGYTVLTTLCHQALIAHGLNVQLGVNHVARYRSDPLVYDLVEPFRAMIDLLLADYCHENEMINVDDWCEYVGKNLKELRIPHTSYSLKLINAIDKAASTLAKSYTHKDITRLWVPSLRPQDD